MDNKEQIDEYIRTKVSEALFKDASDHRQFMESTFKQITWAIGILIIVVAAAGTWLFGKSVESASREKVQQFMKETSVPELLRKEIEAAFSQEKEGIPKRAEEEVNNILESEIGDQLGKQIESKIEELKKISGSELIASQLIGPQGMRGPSGMPGRDGRPGKDLEFPIGTVIQSILGPKEMSSLFGNKWQLADGRVVDPDSTFARSLKLSVLPDLRGVFLRGVNLDRDDGFGDPDGKDRVVGSYQADLFQAHRHAAQIPRNRGSVQVDRGGDGQAGRWENSTEILSVSGGEETRPRNVAVYFYIKVN